MLSAPSNNRFQMYQSYIKFSELYIDDYKVIVEEDNS